jgi:hypothetical protein
MPIHIRPPGPVDEAEVARLWHNAVTWPARIEADPNVQAFRRARAEAERTGTQEPIYRFVRELKARGFEPPTLP